MFGENFEGKELVLAILNKSPEAVTEPELDILRARRSYLTDEEKERYGIEESPSPKKKKK